MRSVLVVLLLVGVVVFAWRATPGSASDPVVTRLSALNGSAFDVAFMQELIPVDEEAVEIAMAATLNADHTDLLQWNQRLIERKNTQVHQMLGWLQAGGASPTHRNVGVATAPVKQMRSLTGAALEKVYLPLMAAHLDHSAALAALAGKRAGRSELRTYAQQIAQMDTQEAAMLRGWMHKWYPK